MGPWAEIDWAEFAEAQARQQARDDLREWEAEHDGWTVYAPWETDGGYWEARNPDRGTIVSDGPDSLLRALRGVRS